MTNDATPDPHQTTEPGGDQTAEPGGDQTAEPGGDSRLYVAYPAEGWEALVKRSGAKDYCYSTNPGEDFFHLIVTGEIFLQRQHEKYCLSCAMRQGIITTDRLHWQHLPRQK